MPDGPVRGVRGVLARRPAPAVHDEVGVAGAGPGQCPAGCRARPGSRRTGPPRAAAPRGRRPQQPARVLRPAAAPAGKVTSSTATVTSSVSTRRAQVGTNGVGSLEGLAPEAIEVLGLVVVRPRQAEEGRVVVVQRGCGRVAGVRGLNHGPVLAGGGDPGGRGVGSLAGPGEQAAHEVALQEEEDRHGQRHSDEGRRGEQLPALAGGGVD